MPTFDTDFADRFTTDAMPPTLFRLPDLTRRDTSPSLDSATTEFDPAISASATPPSPAATSQSTSIDRSLATSAAANFADLAERQHAIDPPAVANDLGTSAHSTETHTHCVDELDLRPERASRQTAAPPNPTDTSSPLVAGEKAGLATASGSTGLSGISGLSGVAGISGAVLANKTIVGLLVLVISAAWWSGQSGSPRAIDENSLAKSIEQGSDQYAIEVGPSGDSIEVELGFPSEFNVDLESLDRSMAANQPASKPTAGPAVVTNARPFQTTAVQTVSSRTANPLFDALEQLASDPNHGLNPQQTQRTSNPLATPSPYRLSQTPHGVDNWTRYMSDNPN